MIQLEFKLTKRRCENLTLGLILNNSGHNNIHCFNIHNIKYFFMPQVKEMSFVEEEYNGKNIYFNKQFKSMREKSGF